MTQGKASEVKLADFQEKTVARIFSLFHSGQKRVLLADEVGLGKTIVARGVIQRVSQWHKEELHDDHFKVVYICSNISIASQNAKKLGIDDLLDVSESRLSMQHLKIYERAGKGHAWQQLIPLTPATSFSMTSGCGTQQERALMYAHIRRLPCFMGLGEKLSRFFACDAEINWPNNVVYYENKVIQCDQNGSHYLAEMAAALTEKLADHGDLVDAIRENCASQAADRRTKSRPLINRLRRIFAEISLARLEPDLVIMDEFQRFRDLIAPRDDGEEMMLSRQFLHDTGTKVLLLSATPYKPYSTLEEIANDEAADHYHEFMEVMHFLFYEDDKRRDFETVWQDYSSALCEVSHGDLSVLVARKNRAEDALYQGICRTERFNTGVISDKGVTEVEISAGDVLSYHAMQSLMDKIVESDPDALHWRRVPVDYMKSSPYLLSFMESYQLKREIRSFCEAHPEVITPIQTKGRYLLLKRDDIHNYRAIPANNARLEQLKRILFTEGSTGSEALLWVPASRPYYTMRGSVFNRQRGFSKVLVFSSWEMVPRMLAVMLSYEAERLTIGKRFLKAPSKRDRGYFAASDERRFGTGRLKNEMEEIVCLVSDTLADLYHPEERLGCSITDLRRSVEKQLNSMLEELSRTRGIPYIVRGGAGEYIACIRALDGDSNARPVGIPKAAARVLADMVIGSPAICAYRMLRRVSSDTKERCAAFAREIAKEVFVSLFNKPESAAVLDLLYDQDDGKKDERRDDSTYYRNVFRYCVEGNLQAVLDEYAHVLGETGEGLKKAIIESVADTTTQRIDTQKNFPDGRGFMMRSHYAAGYFNARTTSENVSRIDRIRKAFNSPFRPFVLATTSIGQEGLDFHCYCRKVMHWNLPSNPIDLEQREGRVNRYKCLAVRQNIARLFGSEPTWDAMFQRAREEMKRSHSDLVPYWCLPDPDHARDLVRIERIAPLYPFSQDRLRYERIIRVLTLYRLTLGQPRQEELISLLGKEDQDALTQLFMDLSPFDRER